MDDFELVNLLVGVDDSRGGTSFFADGKKALSIFGRNFDKAPELYSFTTIEQVVVGSNVFLADASVPFRDSIAMKVKGVNKKTGMVTVDDGSSVPNNIHFTRLADCNGISSHVFFEE